MPGIVKHVEGLVMVRMGACYDENEFQLVGYSIWATSLIYIYTRHQGGRPQGYVKVLSPRGVVPT